MKKIRHTDTQKKNPNKLTLLEHANPTPRLPKISSTPGVELHLTG